MISWGQNEQTPTENIFLSSRKELYAFVELIKYETGGGNNFSVIRKVERIYPYHKLPHVGEYIKKEQIESRI